MVTLEALRRRIIFRFFGWQSTSFVIIFDNNYKIILKLSFVDRFYCRTQWAIVLRRTLQSKSLVLGFVVDAVDAVVFIVISPNFPASFYCFYCFTVFKVNFVTLLLFVPSWIDHIVFKMCNIHK